jgi:hypothetical protein
MNRIAIARGATAMVGPLLLAAIPKCPLCLLPLLAVAGVAVPSGPRLNAVVAAAVIVWTAGLVHAVRTPVPRALAVVAGALVVSGRLLSLAPVTWLGITIMVSIAIVRLVSRERVCARDCPSLHQQRER